MKISSRDGKKKFSILQKLKEKIFNPTKNQKKIFQLHENSNQKFSILRKSRKNFSNPAKIQIENFLTPLKFFLEFSLVTPKREVE